MSIENKPQVPPSILPQPEQPLSIKPTTGSVDPHQVDMLIQRRRDNQNLGLGILGGAIGAAIGAGLWALITSLTNFQIGWMAVGVGFLTGLGVRRFGQGIDKVYGLAGAVLALLGCVAGNLITVCIFASKQNGRPALELLAGLTPSLSWAILMETTDPIGLLIYGIAVYEGYKFSIVRLTQADLTP